MRAVGIVDLYAAHLEFVVGRLNGVLVRAEGHQLLRRAVDGLEHLPVELHNGIGRRELEDNILRRARLFDNGLHLARDQLQDVCLTGFESAGAEVLPEIVVVEVTQLLMTYGQALGTALHPHIDLQRVRFGLLLGLLYGQQAAGVEGEAVLVGAHFDQGARLLVGIEDNG